VFLLKQQGAVMKKSALRIAAAFAFFLFGSSVLSAELKDYVLLVKPMFHQKTRALFLDLAKYFADKGSPELQQYFTSMAGEHAFGTGWVVVDADGQNYIITNRHVVIGAEKVNVYLENAEGAQKAFLDCPILYVDAQMDLAVAQFPGGQKLFKNGFKLDTKLEEDLTEVVAAGFPGFGGEPLWQISKGNITNSQAHIDPAYAYLIQHSAPIDPGNSGGPLLVKDPTTPLGYAVAGVNTLKALKRESTNFAIPARHVAEVLEKAKKARKTVASPAALRSELAKACTVLAGELASDTTVDQNVNRYISYAIVGEKGWQAYQAVLGAAEDQKKFVDWFFDDPVEAMRTSIYWFFRAEASNKKGAVQFTGINPADADAIGRKDQIRTTFTIGDAQKEIAWTWEYGIWRISDMSLDFPVAPSQQQAAQSAQPQAQGTEQSAEKGVTVFADMSLGFGGGLHFGQYSGAYGSSYDAYGDPSFGTFPNLTGSSFDIIFGANLYWVINSTHTLWMGAGITLSLPIAYGSSNANGAVGPGILSLDIPFLLDISQHLSIVAKPSVLGVMLFDSFTSDILYGYGLGVSAGPIYYLDEHKNYGITALLGYRYLSTSGSNYFWGNETYAGSDLYLTVSFTFEFASN
jgi:serine protease Do